MSSEKQEASPEQQREEILKLAERKGYRILRWYVDAGISGDATAKRIDFQQMIADAECGKFTAILCWDQDRFGRFDSIEAGRWIFPLREAGIKLVTVTDGIIDWSDFAGRMLYSIKQEGKHQFLRDLSRNTLRGKLAAARRGDWLEKAKRRLLLLDDDKVPIVSKEIRQLKANQAELAAKLRAASAPQSRAVDEVDAKVDAAMGLYARLRETLKMADTVLVRELLAETIDKVEVWSKPVPRGRRRVFQLQRGVIYLRGSQLENLSRSSRRVHRAS